MLILRALARPPVGPVSATVAPGQCLAVTGPSGSGKSLLLRAIADLDPCTGDVVLGDEDRKSIPAPEWRRRVGYVPAASGWWAPTVGDHLPDGAIAAPLLAAVGLPEAAGWPVSRLSSGETARLALVRALCLRPRVLLLDEPTANLDAAATERVEALLRQTLADGTAIVLASHDRAQVARLAHAELRLRGGRMEATPGEETA